MTTQTIRFYYRGTVREIQEIQDVPAMRAVLLLLRENLHCTGIEEGYAEGDCGHRRRTVGCMPG